MNTPCPGQAGSDDPVVAPPNPVPPQAPAGPGSARNGTPGDAPDAADDGYEPV